MFYAHASFCISIQVFSDFLYEVPLIRNIVCATVLKEVNQLSCLSIPDIVIDTYHCVATNLSKPPVTPSSLPTMLSASLEAISPAFAFAST